MAFGIMRCVSILTVGDTDPAQSGYWSVRESFVSVVLTNMPMVYPLFKSVIDKSRNLSTNKNSALGDSNGYRLGSYPGKQGPKSGSHPLSIPNETTWGSDEHIVSSKVEKTTSGEEASIGSSDKPYLSQGSTAAKSAEEEPIYNNRLSMRTRKQNNIQQNHITITTEYTVSRATPDH
ncbi:hypothetical protein ColLi_10135 [Colletotrichum liriopes]|uniref:Integral membrane protein n=1 Tax=Colletotrichum liriopes TaxID=708192 RepID=A0AA37LWP2_9PEZI|nr:hypothetical protein ColLi_10135 [Colletotrichum liriopes]